MWFWNPTHVNALHMSILYACPCSTLIRSFTYFYVYVKSKEDLAATYQCLSQRCFAPSEEDFQYISLLWQINCHMVQVLITQKFILGLKEDFKLWPMSFRIIIRDMVQKYCLWQTLHSHFMSQNISSFKFQGEILNDDEDAANKMQFVCKPMASNITGKLSSLQDF